METQVRIGPEEIDAAIKQLVDAIVALEPTPENVVVAGIANGGVPFGEILAQALSKRYDTEIPQGQLNITFQRDDLATNPIPSEKYRTSLPVEPNGKTVILADDVIFSGRSARAALAELHDLGRPDCVRLVTLFDRGGRKLPIATDATGFRQEVDASSSVRVELNPADRSQNSITISPK
ncbi:bifunctional pyr operon transcriptional regulator/uracil phosphoribosyltransferase PyrR [Cerasicoccus fimbriatus]|uniref:bifunctional pyr operon transcriptional regulator/uracil phosphoribosyltransferase PyrR n=1 Tax=Cerasicoccus fimbriatus TaxID=3014554 RepID=UPI0022B34117|nr:phosphoribosyltransferase family protein [Cerasicoccus sp. TK19100]